MSNLRVVKAIEEIRAAVRALRVIRAELVTRGDEPAFQTASWLFERGWRYSTDSSRDEYVEYLFWHGHAVIGEDNSCYRSVYDMLGLEEDDPDGYEVLRHLENLTEESSSTPPPDVKAVVARTDMLVREVKQLIYDRFAKPRYQHVHRETGKEKVLCGYADPEIFLSWYPDPSGTSLTVELSGFDVGESSKGLRLELRLLREAIREGDPRLPWLQVRVLRRD